MSLITRAAFACSLSIALASACSPDDGATETEGATLDATGETDETGETGETGSNNTASTGEESGGSGGAPIGEDQHGFVCVDINGGPNLPASALEQTATIRVRLHYAACLRDFYLNAQPDYRQDGALGAEVFENWTDILCTPDADSLAPIACSIAGPDSLTQTLVDDGINATYNLAVDYTIDDPSTIDGGRLRFGPIPLEELTDDSCVGESPTVTIVQVADVQGLDDTNTPLWQIDTFSNTPNKSRVTEGGCINVSAGA